MPLSIKDPDVSYLRELRKDKQEVRDYLAGVHLIDDTVKALRVLGPHFQSHELERLRLTYINATTKCSALLALIEERYFYPML